MDYKKILDWWKRQGMTVKIVIIIAAGVVSIMGTSCVTTHAVEQTFRNSSTGEEFIIRYEQVGKSEKAPLPKN